MKNSFAYFTLGQFAQIHGLNKRTLHYYDEVGLLSPVYRGENGYRYYSFAQSMELENILALKELGMSIHEIKSYLEHPNPETFQAIATKKIEEIEQSITRLHHLKTMLQQRAGALNLCHEIHHGEIQLVELPAQYLLLTPLPIINEQDKSLLNQSSAILNHLKEAWSLSSYRKNCGSYISLEKIRTGNLSAYDGLFTQVDKKRKDLYLRPKGFYLRGFCLGDWENLAAVYQNILSYAHSHSLSLSGFAFECGLNEFAIASKEEYVTQIEIYVASTKANYS